MSRDPKAPASAKQLPTGTESVADFFDSISDQYTSSIMRCVPRYAEMLQVLVDYLPASYRKRPIQILELGAGTGNLSLLLSEYFPHSDLTLVDISADALKVCKERMQPSANASFIKEDFRQLAFGEQSFDLIVSSISIHHLGSLDKQQLFSSCYRWLKPNGKLSFADQFRGQTEEIYQLHISKWHEHCENSGVAEEEWQSWMQHQQDHDYHDTLADHLDWLQQAGFKSIDCLWRHLLWTVVRASK